MNTQTTPPVEPGQEYLACAPTPSMPGEHYTRIRVILVSPLHGEDKAIVATIHRDCWGREHLGRRRMIRLSQLHANPARKTGYRLVQNEDGTPAVVSGVR